MATEKKKKAEKVKPETGSRFKVTVEEDNVEATPKAKPPEATPVVENTVTETTQAQAESPAEIEQKPVEAPAETSSQNVVQNEETYDKKKGNLSFLTIFLAFIISLIIGGALVGGIFYYQNNVDNVTEEVTEPGPTFSPPTETTSPTPNGEGVLDDADLTEYTVQVLNGSGIPGEAGKVEALLVKAGFVDIETGNAKSYDYTETEVSVKEDVPSSIVDGVLDALDSYTTSEGQTLDDGNEFDIVVIIGS